MSEQLSWSFAFQAPRADGGKGEAQLFRELMLDAGSNLWEHAQAFA